MFWLCTERYSSGNISRLWIVESSMAPDSELPCDPQCMIYKTRGSGSCGSNGGCIPYPFNGMGGQVERGFCSHAEAEASLIE